VIEPNDYAYLPRPFLTSPLPFRSPHPAGGAWTRMTPFTQLRVEPCGDSGIPYGQDRLIALLVTTMAVYQNSPVVRLGSAYQMLRALGQAVDGRNYQRLAERFSRFLNARFCFQFRARPADPFVVTRTFSPPVSRSLWYETGARRRDSAGLDNVLELSEDFWTNVRVTAVPVPMRLVHAFVDAPGNLHFVFWILAQSYGVRAGRFFKAPLSGQGSVERHMGLEGYTQARDLRRKIRQWHAETRRVWAECPAYFSGDGEALLICKTPVVHSVRAAGFVADALTNAR
jgi:hypothetical protein